MPLFENHVGVSLSIDKIRIVELVYSDNEFVLENVDEESFEEKLDISSIDENFFNVLQKSFQEITSRRELKSNNISFSLDPEFFKLFRVPFDNTLLQKDLSEHLKWEFTKLHPKLNADDYLLQNIELKKKENLPANYTVVLCLNKKYVEAIQKLCKLNELILRYVDYSHISADVLLRFNKSLKGLNGLSIYKSNKSYSLTLLDDYKPAVLKKSKLINNKLPIDEIKNEMSTIMVNNPGLSSFLFAFISGINIDQSEIDEMNNSLNIKFKRKNPFNEVKLSDKISSLTGLIENPIEYAPAIGIALRLF